ncbi:hypothetical protein Tco_1216845 [Tanacetum coccineum]
MRNHTLLDPYQDGNPTGRIFKTVSLRWIPTGKVFIDSTTKVDSEPPNGSNDDITNPYECNQTLYVSAGTSNSSAGTSVNPLKERLQSWLPKKTISHTSEFQGIQISVMNMHHMMFGTKIVQASFFIKCRLDKTVQASNSNRYGKVDISQSELREVAENPIFTFQVDISRTQTSLGHSLHQQIPFYLHSARSLLHDNIIPKPDLALELGKSISLNEAEEEAVAREVHATHARIVSGPDPEPMQEGPSAGSNQGRSAKRRRLESAASGSAQPPSKDDHQSSKKPRESDASASIQHPALTSTGWQITNIRDDVVNSLMHMLPNNIQITDTSLMHMLNLNPSPHKEDSLRSLTIMKARQGNKKMTKRQPGTGGSNEGIGNILGVPNESTVISRASSEGTRSKPGVPDEEKLIL